MDSTYCSSYVVGKGLNRLNSNKLLMKNNGLSSESES